MSILIEFNRNSIRIDPPRYFDEVLGILVLDGSGSMEEQTAQHISKADAVNRAVNDLFSYFKANGKKKYYIRFSFAIINYDHRSVVRMQATPVKEIDAYGDYNPMEGLGGVTYISEGLKDSKKITEAFLSKPKEKDCRNRTVIILIMADGMDITQTETISIAKALKQMDNVIVTGCFFETLGADAKDMDEAADYIKSLCSEERYFARVSNAEDLRRFFINSMSPGTQI